MFDKISDELVSQVANGTSERKYSNDIALKDETTRNVICSPILDKENKIIGVIEILHSSTKEFTLENETHLRTISALFSIVFEEKERELRELEENELEDEEDEEAFQRKSLTEQQQILSERTSSSGSNSSLKHQRKRSLFDLNYLSEEDFNISEILESRNSTDFKLPNEENMDTSFQNLLRSYSIERRNSELNNYQFGEISSSSNLVDQQLTQNIRKNNSSSSSSSIPKREFVEQQEFLQTKSAPGNDPFQIDQQQYSEQIQNTINSQSTTIPNIQQQQQFHRHQQISPQMIQQQQQQIPMTQQQQSQLTFISEEFHPNENPKKKKKN